MNNNSIQNHAPHWVHVNFKEASVHKDKSTGVLILTVKGETGTGSERGCPVKLVPTEYDTRPDYWGIGVLWDNANAILQTICDYEVSIPLDNIRGTKGIEVVGATHWRQINC
jgi:hypothetical protein